MPAPQQTKRVILPDDPRLALVEIAKYINTMATDEAHWVPAGSTKQNFTGFWQDLEWFHDLMGMACEAERIAKLPENYSST